MQTHKENFFVQKFDLLNSQDANEDICWSSSESSDYENISKNIRGPPTLNCSTRKRVRKKKVQRKNISNLNFSIVDVEKNDKPSNTVKSPIISKLYSDSKQQIDSFKNVKGNTSPILTSKVKRKIKSPVLQLKSQTSIVSPTIKKRLFLSENESKKLKIEECNVMSSVQLISSCKSKVDVDKLKLTKSISHDDRISSIKKSYYTEPLMECGHKVNLSNRKEGKVISTNHTIDVSKPKTKMDLPKEVQSYFDSQFGSDSTSQQSISEIETSTPKSLSKCSDDSVIISSLTQNNDNSPLSVQDSSAVVSYGSWEPNINTEKSKKIKHKKDGLAYRLECLLRKQNASISLWQHEKFLAKNSNFVIPKSEHIVFHINKVNFKYGSYLIEAIDLRDEKHLIFINGFYVTSNCNLAQNTILKLYMPYKILDLINQPKLVINVCKFECVPITM